MIDRVNIVDIMVDKINLEEAKTRVLEFIEDYHTGGGEKQTRMIVTPNSEMIVLARHDPELKAILNRADLSIPDGAGVVLASRIMGNPVPERVAGFDLMQELFSLADSNNFSIYLLGGTAEVIEKVRKDLRKKYPGLKICGSHHGYLNQDIVEEVINDIDKCSPDLLFVGMGVPGQEKFLADNLQRIKAGVALTVGGSFDVLAGQVKRAPDWICKIYLEWLFRLCQEPSRFWRMLALPRFVLLVFFRFLRKYFLDYLGITAGSALIALGLTSFLIPNRIAAGGVSGLATVIFHLTQIPVGIMVLIINLPLFLVSMKILGRSFGARTIYGVISLSFFIDLLQPVVPVITRDLLLASIYGGIIGGLGLGLVFKARGTTGGTDMVARIINHYTGLSTGQGLLLADGKKRENHCSCCRLHRAWCPGGFHEHAWDRIPQ